VEVETFIHPTVSQPTGHKPNLGYEPILGGSQDTFINVLITTSNYFNTYIEKSVFVNVITCSDNAAKLALPLCHRKGHRTLTTRVASLSPNIIGSAKQNYSFPIKVIIQLAKLFQFEK
jgi:hypothetical protein